MAGELRKRLGANIRAHREAAGLSQEAYAFQIQIHRTYMGAIERGERNLTLSSIESLAERIGVDPTTLLLPPADEPPID
jgi:transcriptional regulator with XRE-family HTH domain